MVVLAASIITKSGKALVSRQFVHMTRVWIEGLLDAFPRLVGTGKQHTYIETECVRYVYQPIEDLFLLLVTNKQSNILEDLETLKLLSKLVTEYAPTLDEEGINQTAFELIFAFDEVISLGHKENVNALQVKEFCKMESHKEKLFLVERMSKINKTKDLAKQRAREILESKIEKSRANKGGIMSIFDSGSSEGGFTEMTISNSRTSFGLKNDIEPLSSISKARPTASATAPSKGLGMQLRKTQPANKILELLKAEGEVILDDAPKSSQANAASPSPDPVIFTIEEKLNVVTKRDGGINTFEVEGTLSLQILNQEDGLIQFQTENSDTPGLHFRTHPKIDKDLFKREHIVGSKEPNTPFSTGQNDVALMKWRIQGMDEGSLPLTVNCWPSVSTSETVLNIEYKASNQFDLWDVTIAVPLPTLREPPSVRQIDGKWRYDARNSTFEWSILLIDDSNRSGSMEFVVPPSDSSAFFPINIKFTATSTFGNVKVTSVMPLRGVPPPKFSQRIQLTTENYQVI